MKFFLLLGWLVGFAHAQIQVGAILPLSGALASVGEVQEAALRASAEALEARGVVLEITLRDSRSRPDRAAARVQELLDSGVHILVCCETPEVGARVTPLAAAAGLSTLTLAPSTAADVTWLFALAPDETAPLERLSLETPLHPFGLMAPVGRAGDLAAERLQPKVGAARYPVARPPLTPEALQIATREPASVVVWDNGEGTVRATEALSARGYGGAVIVRADIWDDLNALERAKLTGARSVLSPAVLGYTLSDAHPSKAAVSSFRRALIVVPDGALTGAALAAGAGAWDAAQLIGSAAEQVLAYNVVTDTEAGREAVRGALRDALVTLGPVTGAGGTYDFTEGDFSDGSSSGLQPDSLVLAEWRSGRFRPLP